jgi:hypothetical protein
MVQQWCERNQSAVYQSTKDGNSTIHQEEKFNEVKYLGLILYKGLTWKAQLKNVMNKAYRAFWTCKGTFGRTYSLKPRVVFWIYTMVIRVVLYS